VAQWPSTRAGLITAYCIGIGGIPPAAPATGAVRKCVRRAGHSHLLLTGVDTDAVAVVASSG
jgi:hypothetical protein